MTIDPSVQAAIARDYEELERLERTRLLTALERDLDALDTCVLGKPAAQRISRRLRTRVGKLAELFAR